MKALELIAAAAAEERAKAAAFAALAERVEALEAAICHCPDCTMHREKARHASKAAQRTDEAVPWEDVRSLAAALWAVDFDCTFREAELALAKESSPQTTRYNRMAQAALAHLPYLKLRT